MTCLLLDVGPRLGRCKCHGRKACVNGMFAARTVTVVTRRARQTRGFFQGKQFQVTWASSLLQARLMHSKCFVARVATHALSLRRASWRALGGEAQSASTTTRRSRFHHHRRRGQWAAHDSCLFGIEHLRQRTVIDGSKRSAQIPTSRRFFQQMPYDHYVDVFFASAPKEEITSLFFADSTLQVSDVRSRNIVFVLHSESSDSGSSLGHLVKLLPSVLLCLLEFLDDHAFLDVSRRFM